VVQVGKLLRTVFLCDYFVNEAFRRELLRVLNRGEAVNALKRSIYVGRVSSYQAKKHEEMQAVADAQASQRSCPEPTAPMKGAANLIFPQLPTRDAKPEVRAWRLAIARGAVSFIPQAAAIATTRQPAVIHMGARSPQ
jgi:hypothetical protein